MVGLCSQDHISHLTVSTVQTRCQQDQYNCDISQLHSSIMVRTVIYNASVLALDEDDTFYYPGTVEFEDDRITKIYGGSPAIETERTDVIWLDGKDKLIMPGLIDLHFHTSIAKVKLSGQRVQARS
jgi:adenine deaminase